MAVSSAFSFADFGTGFIMNKYVIPEIKNPTNHA
jgi:hypothetical protein